MASYEARASLTGGDGEDDYLLAEAADAAERAEAAEPRQFTVLYDVDGCAVAFTLALLTDQMSAGNLYVISYLEDGSGEYMASLGDATVRATPAQVRFCLLNQIPCGEGASSDRRRIRPAFVCDFPATGDLADALDAALSRGQPIPVEAIRRCLNEEATFALHDDFVVVLALTTGAAAVQLEGPKSATKKKKAGGRADAEALRAAAHTFPRGRRGLTTLYVRHEQKTIAAFRRVFGGSATTAFWYVSKFGPHEKTLVLCTRYYLMQAADAPDCAAYDLQAVKDLCLTYEVPPSRENASGLHAQDLSSFARLSRFCCGSGYARGPAAVRFPTYVSLRAEADTAEVNALKGFIERDRGGLRIPDGEFVKYVYLAYFECYNKSQLNRHLRAVTATTVDFDPRGKSSLGANAIEGFFTHIRSQLNIADYVASSVTTEFTRLREEVAAEYVRARTYDTLALVPRRDGRRRVAIWGCAAQMVKRMDDVEKILSLHGWPATGSLGDGGSARTSAAFCSLGEAPSRGSEADDDDHGLRGDPMRFSEEGATAENDWGRQRGPGIVRRLLAVSCADPPPGSPSVAAAIFGTRARLGPLPVYRTAATRGRQLFGLSVAEEWDRCVRSPSTESVSAATAEALASRVLNPAEADAGLTAALKVSQEADRLARLAAEVSAGKRPLGIGFLGSAIGTDASDQIYGNRNEIFNSNLAVGHIILDVDMQVRGPIPYITLHAAMRGFRIGLLTALKILLPDAAVDWDAHPVYFYKSECPKDGEDRGRGRGAGDLNFDLPDERVDCGWGEDEDVYAMDLEAAPDGLADPCQWDDLDFDAGYDYSETSLEFEGTTDCLGENVASRGGTLDPPESLAASTTSRRFAGACTCRDKVGMRVCVPMPAPYVLHGAAVVHGVARVIQQAVLLERKFVEAVGPYLRDYDIIDTGVYAHGRSLRMPFFSKLKDDGTEGGRLLPFYVLPERCATPESFVGAHFAPSSFHAHALPPDNSSPTTVLRGMGGVYVSFFDRKSEINRAAFYRPRVSLSAELGKRGIELSRGDSLETFVAEAVLADVETYFSAHFPERADEYKNVTAECRVVKSDWALLQIVPRDAPRYRQRFTCVRYKHRRPAGDSVRTYISLSIDAHGRLCASVSQQCFASKCGSNKLRTLFTVEVAER